MQPRQFGAFRISRVLEYSGPTHAAEFLFPGEDHTAIETSAARLAPHHLAPHHDVPPIRKLVVTVQL